MRLPNHEIEMIVYFSKTLSVNSHPIPFYFVMSQMCLHFDFCPNTLQQSYTLLYLLSARNSTFHCPVCGSFFEDETDTCAFLTCFFQSVSTWLCCVIRFLSWCKHLAECDSGSDFCSAWICNVDQILYLLATLGTLFPKLKEKEDYFYGIYWETIILSLGRPTNVATIHQFGGLKN